MRGKNIAQSYFMQIKMEMIRIIQEVRSDRPFTFPIKPFDLLLEFIHERADGLPDGADVKICVH